MYVVVGANGFLGAYMRQAIRKMTQEDILALDKVIDGSDRDGKTEWMQCDITKPEDVKQINSITKQSGCHKIIYLAAYHHPDMVEKNPRMAWDINITALSYFMNTLENVECFFYPSSDSVYGDGGISYHFKESDHLNPVNRYGRHKAAAECLVNAYGYNVVRFPFLIAPSLLSYKNHFYDQIAEAVQQGRKMEMFADSMRSSLDFGTAADLVIQLIENYSEQMPKILNVSGDDDLSKYDIGKMIARRLGVSENLIVPISADHADGIFEAKRAKSTLLDNSEIKKYLRLKEIKIKI